MIRRTSPTATRTIATGWLNPITDAREDEHDRRDAQADVGQRGQP